MKAEDLKLRTKKFALSIIKLSEGIAKTVPSNILTRQIIRAATSVGANYRAACRARSRAEFAAKIRIALEEADETQYWLELFFELKLIDEESFTLLHREADELISIFVSSAKTATKNKK